MVTQVSCQFKRDEAFVTTQEVERNNQEYSTSSEEGNNNNTKIGKCVGEVAGNSKGNLPSQNRNKCDNVLQKSIDAKKTVGNNNNPPGEIRRHFKEWISNLKEWNGKSMIKPKVDLVIRTDVTNKIWEAVFKQHKIQGV